MLRTLLNSSNKNENFSFCIVWYLLHKRLRYKPIQQASLVLVFFFFVITLFLNKVLGNSIVFYIDFWLSSRGSFRLLKLKGSSGWTSIIINNNGPLQTKSAIRGVPTGFSMYIYKNTEQRQHTINTSNKQQ